MLRAPRLYKRDQPHLLSASLLHTLIVTKVNLKKLSSGIQAKLLTKAMSGTMVFEKCVEVERSEFSSLLAAPVTLAATGTLQVSVCPYIPGLFTSLVIVSSAWLAWSCGGECKPSLEHAKPKWGSRERSKFNTGGMGEVVRGGAEHLHR